MPATMSTLAMHSFRCGDIPAVYRLLGWENAQTVTTGASRTSLPMLASGRQVSAYFLTRMASKNQPFQNITSLFRFKIKTVVQLMSTAVTGLGSLSPSTFEFHPLRTYNLGSTFCASNSVSPQSRSPNATLSFLIVKIWPTSCAASRSSREVMSALSIGLVNRH